MGQNDDGPFCSAKIQLSGVLLKKPFGHQSSKWSKRFFVLKDGFLLYYPDNEKKDFEKKRYFNIHPKGVMPLDGCQFDKLADAGQQWAIQIKNENYMNLVSIAAETEWEREKWFEMLQQSSRITWKNAKLGEAMIQQLEAQGLKMAHEKQDYFDKFQNEALALQDEKERAEELERIKIELEKEKAKMELLSVELREEYEKIKGELTDTVENMQQADEDKQKLKQTTESLQGNLEALAREKEKIIADLKDRDATTEQLRKENQHLSMKTKELSSNLQQLDEEKERTLAELQKQQSIVQQISTDQSQQQGFEEKLHEIEEQTKQLLLEKAEADQRLKEKEEWANQLAVEKQFFNEQACELQDSIKDLTAQKEMTEAELKVEVIARLDAEKRLQEAEYALGRLDKNLNTSSTTYTKVTKDEMLGDVKHLKKFFEGIAAEAKFDINKPVIFRNAIHARKTVTRRAKSMRLEKRRKTKATRSAEKLGNADTGSHPDLLMASSNPSTSLIRRAATTMAKDPLMKITALDSAQKMHSTDV